MACPSYAVCFCSSSYEICLNISEGVENIVVMQLLITNCAIDLGLGWVQNLIIAIWS